MQSGLLRVQESGDDLIFHQYVCLTHDALRYPQPLDLGDGSLAAPISKVPTTIIKPATALPGDSRFD